MGGLARRSATWAAALGLAAGCGPGEAPRGPAPLRSFPVFDAPAAEPLRVDEVLAREEVQTWPLRGGARGWESHPDAVGVERGPKRLTVPARERPLQLLREVDLDAGSVQSIAVTFDRTRVEPWMRLCFRRAGEAEEERCQSVHRKSGGQGPNEPLRFWPARLPGWQGRIAALRLVVGPLDEPVRLAHVEAEAWSLRRDALERPWRVGLEREAFVETRPALLAPLGEAFARRIAVPAEGGRLELGFGGWPFRPVPVAVRISVREAPGAAARPLVERRIAASERVERTGQPDADPLPWRDLELDLAPWAGREIDLLFEARPEGEAPVAPAVALGAWSGLRLRGAAPAARPNVVVVSLDTLRADHLSLYGYPRPTSPRLDAYARRCGVVFERALASAPWTLPSHVSLFTGLDALSHRVHFGGRVPETLVTLAERLREAGYTSASVTGGLFLAADYGMAQGFDRSLDVLRTHEPQEPRRGVEAAIAQMERLARREPFLLFFHTYDVHAPYRARHRFEPALGTPPLPDDRVVNVRAVEHPEAGEILRARELVWAQTGRWWEHGAPLEGEAELRTAIDLYDTGIAHTDALLGRLLDAIRAGGLEDRTLVVVTSDHGELFGERGLYGHAYLLDENLRVPLVVGLPGCARAGTRVARTVGSVDVVPTVLELAGLGVPEGLDGRSLLAALDAPDAEAGARDLWSYAAGSNQGVALHRGDRWKYVLNDSGWAPLHGHEELYDLRRDPRQERNLADGGDPARSLRAQTFARLREDAREPVLRVANPGPAPLRVRVEGGVSPKEVKALEPLEARVRWAGGGAFDLEVPPAGRAGLVLLKGVPASLSLRVDGPGLPGATVLEVPARRDEPWSAAPGPDGWREVGACPSAGARICLSPGTGSGADPAAADAALRERLRALGYAD